MAGESALAYGTVARAGGNLLSNFADDERLEAQSKILQGTYEGMLPILNQSYTDAIGMQQPYLQAGASGLSAMQGLMTQGVNAPTAQRLNYQMPQRSLEDFGTGMLQNRINAGQQAIDQSASAMGGLLSGATQRELMQMGQELGSEENQNIWNRYMQQNQLDRQDRDFALDELSNYFNQELQSAGLTLQDLNRRGGMASNVAGIGQSSANTTGQLRVGQGQQQAQIMEAIGNQQAQQVERPWYGYAGDLLSFGGQASQQYGGLQSGNQGFGG